MGISGLLPFVKKACRKGCVKEIEGKTVAVDVSFLLHKGIFGCVEEIARQQETKFYITYVWKYINVLLHHKCHVIMVFDGQPLPAKKNVNDSRKARREKNQKLGEQLLKEGLKDEAHRAFQQGITITADIVEKTIEAFRDIPHVDVIVAPYEADAQMAYLLQCGLAHAAVTEDSDLIVFGCEKIIFKLETNGDCLFYERVKLPQCVCSAIQKRFEFSVFRRICILAGCDYLHGGLPGVGLKKAEIFFSKTNQSDLRVVLPRISLYLNMSNLKISVSFIEDFIKAENTFLYQVVFDPINRKHVTLNPLPTPMNPHESVDHANYAYAGVIDPPHQALRRALGNVDLKRPPMTDKFSLPSSVPPWSIWAGVRHLQHLANVRHNCEREEFKKFGAFVVSPKNMVRRSNVRNASIVFPHTDAIESPASVRQKSNALFPPAQLTESDLASSTKRSQIPLMDNASNESNKTLAEDGDDKNNNGESTNKIAFSRSRLSGSIVLKNGSVAQWNSNEWMKIYGSDLENLSKKKSEEERNGGEVAGGEANELILTEAGCSTTFNNNNKFTRLPAVDRENTLSQEPAGYMSQRLGDDHLGKDDNTVISIEGGKEDIPVAIDVSQTSCSPKRLLSPVSSAAPSSVSSNASTMTQLMRNLLSSSGSSDEEQNKENNRPRQMILEEAKEEELCLKPLVSSPLFTRFQYNSGSRSQVVRRSSSFIKPVRRSLVEIRPILPSGNNVKNGGDDLSPPFSSFPSLSNFASESRLSPIQQSAFYASRKRRRASLPMEATNTHTSHTASLLNDRLCIISTDVDGRDGIDEDDAVQLKKNSNSRGSGGIVVPQRRSSVISHSLARPQSAAISGDRRSVGGDVSPYFSSGSPLLASKTKNRIGIANRTFPRVL